jgi:hypothetical protein
MPSTTMAAITVPARASPVAKEMADRIASRTTSGLRRIFNRRIGQPAAAPVPPRLALSLALALRLPFASDPGGTSAKRTPGL